MKTEGIIFDIKQLAVFDGPGIRTTVFLKGCPLRCMWCHNPEGLSVRAQRLRSVNGCLHCGRCHEICQRPGACNLCGDCVRACPKHLIKICGRTVSSEWLVEYLLKEEDYLKRVGGGITFSGGEPLMQPEFLMECLRGLSSVHTCMETSGYAPCKIFREAVELLDYIIMDIKLEDGRKHAYYTGVDNGLILENLEYLKKSGKPFRIRIPVIPGVNDDWENMTATAALLTGVKSLDFVELLPYHTTAGAKYAMTGLPYQPEFDETRIPNCDTTPFERAGIPCKCI